MAFWHWAHSDKCFFSASYFRINASSITAGKRIVVWYCHATCQHRKPPIFISIVYDFFYIPRTVPVCLYYICVYESDDSCRHQQQPWVAPYRSYQLPCLVRTHQHREKKGGCWEDYSIVAFASFSQQRLPAVRAVTSRRSWLVHRAVTVRGVEARSCQSSQFSYWRIVR
jgi:hypothetical protein